MAAYVRLPKYFEIYGRKEPTDQTHHPCSFASGKPEATFWELVNQEPERMRAFMQSMNTLEAQLPILGIYDFSWVTNYVQNEPQRVLFVDMGGSKGQATIARVPEVPRTRFVLQDLQDVIEEARNLKVAELEGERLMANDFHRGQPIKGKLLP